MFSNIRQKLLDLWTDQTNVANSSNTRNTPQTSLLEKLGGIFNLSDTAQPTKKSLQQTALRNVSTHVNLSNDDINNQLRRQAVREGVVSDINQSEDNSAFYLSFGYHSLPIEIDIAVQPTQAEIMQLAYAGFADKAGLSEAGAEEFIKQ